MEDHLFLPFSKLGRTTEHLAIDVKKALGLGLADAVDPFALLSLVPARLIEPKVFRDGAPPHIRRVLFETDADAWSAIGWGQSPATGEELILVNPTHHPHRQRASLMEEIVHIVLRHPKTELSVGEQNVRWVRPYNETVEEEAFRVGAACILPWSDLFRAVYRDGEDAAMIADRYDVSTKYVSFRINTAGLAKVYAKQQRVVRSR